MMSWQWVRGEPVLRKLSSLPRYTLTVPQKTGAPAVVPLRCVTDAQKTLGVWSCLLVILVFMLKRRWRKGACGLNGFVATVALPPKHGWGSGTRSFRNSLMAFLLLLSIPLPLTLLSRNYTGMFCHLSESIRISLCSSGWPRNDSWDWVCLTQVLKCSVT